MNYRKNYIQTYLWQAVSVLLGFASLFVVVPYLSSNKTLYGIYSVCTSLTIFFSYADLGFLSGGVKYAAEYYIRGEKENEMKVVGFTAFIMLSVFFVLALVMFFLGINPRMVIPELELGTENYRIAQWLLLTLAVSCPVIISQRILSIIFTIRVQDFVYQRFSILGNICRILSVFYFFGSGRYMVIEYFVFYQLISLLVVSCALVYTRKFGYNVVDFIKTIRFDKAIFDKVKHISGTSLLMMISMILYYELDQLFISNLIGIESVAIYGAALSVLALVRQFCSVVYSPYTSRYNHYVGLGDYLGLSIFVRKMIYIFTPIIVLPIFSISLFSSPFIHSWIGENYADSALLVSFLVFSFAFNSVQNPISSFFIAMEQNKVLVKYSLLLPVVYWAGIAATFHFWGLTSFAVFKTVVPLVISIGYWLTMKRFLKKEGLNCLSFGKLMWSIALPILVLIVYRYFMELVVSYEHTKMALFQNVMIIGGGVLISLTIALILNQTLRELVKSYMNTILSKFHKLC